MKLHYFLILLVGLSITSTINGTSFSGNDISYKDSFISQLTENYPLYLEGEFSQSSTRSL